MKNPVLILTILLVSITQPSFSQISITETAKLASLCQFWGFLKYYHPKVARGKFDWDHALLKKIPLVRSAKNKAELNVIYYNWLIELGKGKKRRNCKNDVPDGLKYNLDLRWIDNRSMIEDSLGSLLHFILENRNRGRSYYVEGYPAGNTHFIHEKEYKLKEYAYPSPEYRLLSLYRYWNIIEYFYPYKNIIGADWNDVLNDMIPKFLYAKDTVSYHMAMRELTARLNDSHAYYWDQYVMQFYGLYLAPFKCKIIDSIAVVTICYSDSFCMRDDIRIGDEVLEINDTTVAEMIKKNWEYIGGSNSSRKLMLTPLLNGHNDSLKIRFRRDGVISSKIIHRYLSCRYHYDPKKKEVFKMLDFKTAYVNMGELTRKQFDSLIPVLKRTNAIIFDVRNYPKGTMYQVADFLNSEPKPFAKFTYPVISFPGLFKWTKPYNCGNHNPDYYKGKVVLLFDESTQSHAEFTCMALQTAPNVKSIGSQTSGADGDVSEITFPGGYKSYMTGIGVFYPDGRQTQRIGIIPDIMIKPTASGIKAGKDEVLERALEYIKTGK
jgi:carboxyl-terminal processing protease